MSSTCGDKDDTPAAVAVVVVFVFVFVVVVVVAGRDDDMEGHSLLRAVFEIGSTPPYPQRTRPEEK